MYNADTNRAAFDRSGRRTAGRGDALVEFHTASASEESRGTAEAAAAEAAARQAVSWWQRWIGPYADTRGDAGRWTDAHDHTRSGAVCRSRRKDPLGDAVQGLSGRVVIDWFSEMQTGFQRC